MRSFTTKSLFSAGPALCFSSTFLDGRSQFETKTSNGALDDGASGAVDISIIGMELAPISRYLKKIAGFIDFVSQKRYDLGVTP